MNAIKAMVCDVDKRKQYLGFVLTNVVFDPRLCCMESSINYFNKSIVNPVIQAINNTVNKNELLSDMVAIAMKAWETIMHQVFRNYEMQTHNSAATSFKTITQTLWKKLDAQASQGNFA